MGWTWGRGYYISYPPYLIKDTKGNTRCSGYVIGKPQDMEKVIVNEIVEEDYKRLTRSFLKDIADNWEGEGLYAIYLAIALNRKWAEYVIRN